MLEQLQKQFEEDTITLVNIFISKDPLPPFYVRNIAAPILRRWFIDKNLIRLQSELKCNKFELLAPDTKKIFELIKSKNIYEFYLTGGVYLGGEFLRSIYFSHSTPEEAFICEFSYEFENISISKFLNSNRVFYNGEIYNVEKILRIYANKYGGVHLDNSRQKDWELNIDGAVKFIKFGNPEGKYKEVKLMSKLDDGYSEDSLYFLALPKEEGFIWTVLDVEVLAIAQALINLSIDGKKIITIP